MTKVLVTGAAGYIGSVLCRQLLDKGYHVRGLDSLKFGGDALHGFLGNSKFEFHKGDVRSKEDVAKALDGIDGVIHLAAIVGDPACSKEADLAKSTNWDGAVNIFDQSRESGVKRFIFASTCSNYGRAKPGEIVSEDSELNPVSLYAELKVKFEKYLLASEKKEGFTPVVLRFATVYGLSPRMRFDLTVNEFIREVALGKELEIFGEQFWRPYCHVEDLAGSCVTAFESSPEDVAYQVFGVGDSQENYQKKMLADEIFKIDGKAQISFVKKDEDPRDYRVDFNKIKEKLGFKITKTVPEGLEEVYHAVRDGIFDDPYSQRYRNI